jgi:hypothetical protein
MGEGRPFPIVYNVADMMEGWGKLRRRWQILRPT